MNTNHLLAERLNAEYQRMAQQKANNERELRELNENQPSRSRAQRLLTKFRAEMTSVTSRTQDVETESQR